jgi:hypothetical protein
MDAVTAGQPTSGHVFVGTTPFLQTFVLQQGYEDEVGFASFASDASGSSFDVEGTGVNRVSNERVSVSTATLTGTATGDVDLTFTGVATGDITKTVGNTVITPNGDVHGTAVGVAVDLPNQ